MYEAYNGFGAFLNGKRIKVSKIDELKRSIVTSGLTPELHIEKGKENGMLMFIMLLNETQRVRILGSSVLQICEVASGHTEGFCGTKLKPWDFAASAVILREAGGKITDFSDNEITLQTQDFICSNNFIHDDLINICKDTGNF
jgi:myo-inositol-1(or 4)-monophosphatase